MALGRRCELGCETWPDDNRYNKCPTCGEDTTRYKGVTPLEQDEANHAEFLAFYEEWDKRPAVRLQMTPEESLKWDALYPNGRPDTPAPKAS